MLGVQASPYLEAGMWQFNFGYRYQKSDRHFTGSHEDKNRAREHSEVINKVHLMDFGITHAFTKRISGSASLPVLIATRSTPIRNASNDLIGRDLQRTEAIGDLVVSAKSWVLDPETFLRGNFAFSLGVKLPTGQDDVRHKATVRRGNVFTREERTVDQSIQPGDGSFGAILGLDAFYQVYERITLFAAGSYLLNPRATNGVPTFRNGSGEEEMSVTDAYLAKVGIASPIPFLEKYGFSVSLAGRLEGVPVRDLIGSSRGFRRPGYAYSIEPGIAWSMKGHTLGVSAPVALYRNRQRSVPDDRAEPQRHGDAAFADYMILVSYSWAFGGPEATASSPKAGATPTLPPPSALDQTSH